MTIDELTKNHQEDENTASGRMYSRDGRHIYFVCILFIKERQSKQAYEITNLILMKMYNFLFLTDELCPVKSFMKYLKHIRGNKCDRLFQRPSKGNCRWYDSAPVGHNTIGSMMASDYRRKRGYQ
jgi:hypothetical protein